MIKKKRFKKCLGCSSIPKLLMFIGAYEAPIWGSNGWLEPLNEFGDDADFNRPFDFQL